MPIVGDPPTWGVVPIPLVLLVGGVLSGLFLALVSRWLARVGARRRGRVMDKRLRASIDAVAEAEIVVPVGLVLDRHGATRVALTRAGGRLTPRGRSGSLRPQVPDAVPAGPQVPGGSPTPSPVGGRWVHGHRGTGPEGETR